jgi:hypothetical protein
MGSIALDNGESVYIHDAIGSADPVAVSAAEGSSLVALMQKRERFDFTWANSTERGAQTGMLQGSRGYQEDTKAEYVYESGAWRVTPAFIQFTATGQATTAATNQQMTGWTLASSASTDTSLATWDTNHFVLPRTGIYIVSMYGLHSGAGATAYFACGDSSSWSTAANYAIGPVENTMGSLTFVFNATAVNSFLYFWNYNTNAGTLTSQEVRISRIS